MPLLEANNIVKSYSKTGLEIPILNGLSMSVDKGEILVLIGPSGSGKSTLLRCFNLLEIPTEGSIIVDNIDMQSKSTNINQIRRSIGMVFQQFNLYPHLTVLSNITLALRKVDQQVG